MERRDDDKYKIYINGKVFINDDPEYLLEGYDWILKKDEESKGKADKEKSFSIFKKI